MTCMRGCHTFVRLEKTCHALMCPSGDILLILYISLFYLKLYHVGPKMSSLQQVRGIHWSINKLLLKRVVDGHLWGVWVLDSI